MTVAGVVAIYYGREILKKKHESERMNYSFGKYNTNFVYLVAKNLVLC
jgi:hypothetical protein